MSELQEYQSNGLKVHLIYVVSSKSRFGAYTEEDDINEVLRERSTQRAQNRKLG